MRLVTNETLIKRNATIGRYATGAGLVVLVSALIFNFLFIVPPGSEPRTLPLPFLTELVARPEAQFVPVIALVVGFLLSNIGTAYSNRWVRPPRPDEALDAALKGLDDRHVLYHYRLPASHVLVAPSGVYALLPKRQGGRISFAEGKWKQEGHSRFMAIFAQDGLGNPTLELEGEMAALQKYLDKNLPEAQVPVRGIVVFTNTAVAVDADEAPLPSLHTKKLKEYIRRQPKSATLSKTMLNELNARLGLNGAAPQSDDE